MLQELIDLIYPSFCVICEKKVNQKNFPVCEDCINKIKPLPEPICQVCGQPSFQSPCFHCEKSHPFFSQARAVGIYEGVLKECIYLFKYHRKTNLSRPLSTLLLNFLWNNPKWTEVDYLIPVPLTQRRLRERGFNQSEFLARRVGKSLNIRLSINDLKRKDSSLTQIKADRQERSENVSGAFYVRRAEFFWGKRILLIDDVLTTGSTANACAKVLKKNGSKEILVLTIARTV